MGKSNGQCHFKKKRDRVSYAFVYIFFEKNIVRVEKKLILVVYEGEKTKDLLLVNLVICI